jgi:sigma-54 specific flagellar transcriptional regulator A
LHNQGPVTIQQTMKDFLETMLMGASPDTVALRALIKTLAASDSTVLVTGESGTGKELVAKALHASSPRSSGPFVPINCGAIPRELIESELFGHRKGSFTGALADRPGRFELAQGGTLFLDEIGDLPLDMQVKLLRVLQERCVLPVGGSKEVPIDVRVVAATHRKLEDEVARGRFREDLYYRINVLPIFTTALRQRPADTKALLLHYAQKFAMPGRRPIRFSQQMMDMLVAYGWPGNVRELSNLVDRFTTLFPEQEIQPHRIPASMMPSGLAQLQAKVAPAPEQVQSTPGLVPDALVDTLHKPEAVPALTSGSVVGGDEALDALLDVAGQFGNAKSGLWREPLQPAMASNDEVNPVEETILLAQGIPTLPPEGISLKQHLVDIEKSLIEQALRLKDGNVSQTARILQLQRTTLIEKINKYDLRVSG